MAVVNVTITPLTGKPGVPTRITFSEDAVPGDRIALLPALNCTGAAAALMTVSSLGVTEVSSSRTVSTSLSMVSTVDLSVCYATIETVGVDAHIFGRQASFMNTQIDYEVRRIVQGSGPHSIVITGLTLGDEIILSKESSSTAALYHSLTLK